MELVVLDIEGIGNVYTVSVFQKEFIKAVNESWKKKSPWPRYQRKLIEDLAVLVQEKERAIDFSQFEKLSGVDGLYCIRHPESRKNVRIIYTIYEGLIILLMAFLEKNDGDYQRAIKTSIKRLRELAH